MPQRETTSIKHMSLDVLLTICQNEVITAKKAGDLERVEVYLQLAECVKDAAKLRTAETDSALWRWLHPEHNERKTALSSTSPPTVK